MLFNESIYWELPRASELLPISIVKLSSRLFASDTGLSGRQILDFFGKYSEEVARMRYGKGMPSRWIMFERFLESLPLALQRQALLELCRGYPMRTQPPQEEVDRLRRMINADSIPRRSNESADIYDVFICHASEDKGFTDLLASKLRAIGIRVWYDQFILSWGDDLRTTIDHGLARSKYGIVVFSHFFLKKKKWTEYELNGLFAKESQGLNVVLPIWHNVTEEDLKGYSLSLANRFAKDTKKDSIDEIVASLREKLDRFSV